MFTIFGTLVKITPEKRLLVSIESSQYEYLNKRFANIKKPVFQLTTDNGPLYFVKVFLDKYDSCNLPKFERLIKKRVIITGKFSSWTIQKETPISGVSFVLVSIFQRKESLTDLEQEIDDDVEKHCEKNSTHLASSPSWNKRSTAM